MFFEIPAPVLQALEILEKHGFACYIVGGCVRDSVMGRIPTDWDIATNALPEQVKRCFSGYTVHDTGLAHGTVTAVIDSMPLEITTYRIDGDYADHRRPQDVTFTDSLRTDLARRDFTVNAMAYHPRAGLRDFFGGTQDIRNRLIRCVGDADKRFNEDALRIMRAMRFASVLGFGVDPQTAESMHKNKALLGMIAAERINAELIKLIAGEGAPHVIDEFLDVVCVFIPELAPSCKSNSNCTDTRWQNMLSALNHTRPVPALRLAILFCGAGPPAHAGYDAQNNAQHCAKVFAERLRQLKCDNVTIALTTDLIRHCQSDITSSPESVKRWLSRLGKQNLRLLLEMRRSFLIADKITNEEKLVQLEKTEKIIADIISQKQCYRIKDLQIDGNDLLAIGIKKGPLIGKILERLLDMVIAGDAENEASQLIAHAKRIAGEQGM